MPKWSIHSLAAGVRDCLLLLLLLGPVAWPASARAQTPDEYPVKAAFIHNFLKYVEWPATGGCQNSAGFKLAILGADPFGHAFDKFRGKPIGGCLLEIAAVSSIEPLDRLQAVYISGSEQAGLQRILAKAGKLPILTIGDSPGYMRAGVMINLIRREDKLGFEINLKAARAAGLKISSQLLNLASTIIEE